MQQSSMIANKTYKYLGLAQVAKNNFIFKI